MPVLHSILVLCAALLASPLQSQTLPMTRIPAYRLRMPSPGVAVIRDSLTWTTLWRRFEQWGRSDTGIVHAPVPAVDFRKSMLLAVSYGSRSGCGNSASYIRRVLERRDSLVVVVGSIHRPAQPTCMMVIEPVDVTKVPRIAKPVAFHSGDAGIAVPPAADWSSHPTMAQLDSMPENIRSAMTFALVRDPSTPLPMLRAIVRRHRPEDWMIVSDLIRRPDVRSDVDILETLSGLASYDRREVDSLILERFGLIVARDSSTPQPVLLTLVNSLKGELTPRSREMAELLLHNERVLADSALLVQYYYTVRAHPELQRGVCRAFVSRYPGWARREDSHGKRTGVWERGLPCSDPPPPPAD